MKGFKKSLCFLVFGATLFSTLITGADVTDDFKKFYLDGNFEKASKYIDQIDRNDEKAILFIGNMYNDGNGVSADAGKAYEYYRIAANQNNHMAQYRLGLWYVQNGNKIDQAIPWFKKSLRQGNIRSLNFLRNLVRQKKYPEADFAQDEIAYNTFRSLEKEKNAAKRERIKAEEEKKSAEKQSLKAEATERKARQTVKQLNDKVSETESELEQLKSENKNLNESNLQEKRNVKELEKQYRILSDTLEEQKQVFNSLKQENIKLKEQQAGGKFRFEENQLLKDKVEENEKRALRGLTDNKGQSSYLKNSFEKKLFNELFQK